MSQVARACPACGRGNDPDRELCRGCGVDLDDGHRWPAARPARPQPPTRRRRGVGVPAPLLAVLVGVALLLAALTWAGLGPLASGTQVPGADFDPPRYTADPAPLPLADIAARTSRDAASTPAMMADDDPATAWRSEGTAAGLDVRPELIELGLARPGWIDRLVWRNGDHTDADAYADSARIARVRLRTDAGEVLLADLLDLGLEPQELVLPEPVLASELRLEILEVYPGDTDDIALSEIDLVGWTADEMDAELARERAQRHADQLPDVPLGGSIGRR